MQALEIAFDDNGSAALSHVDLDVQGVKQHAFMAACEALSLCNVPLAGLAAPEAALIKHLAVPVDNEVTEGLARYLVRLMDGKAATLDALEAAKVAAAHAGALDPCLITLNERPCARGSTMHGVAPVRVRMHCRSCHVSPYLAMCRRASPCACHLSGSKEASDMSVLECNNNNVIIIAAAGLLVCGRWALCPACHDAVPESCRRIRI
jgi:hypothetical protein